MKDESFIDFDSLDPAVNSLLGGAQRRAAARVQTPRQRKQAAKDKKRNRRMIDINPSIERELENTAAALGVPFSNLVNYLLAGLLPVDVEKIKKDRVLTRSMRFEYILEISATTKGLP